MLPLIAIFALYEASMHFSPKTITVFDLLDDKIPLFVQKAMLKTFLSVIIAIIRTKHLRKLTSEKVLLSELQKEHTGTEYK